MLAGPAVHRLSTSEVSPGNDDSDPRAAHAWQGTEPTWQRTGTACRRSRTSS